MVGANISAVRVIREYIRSEEQQRYATLLANYGHKKNLPTGYELQALLALSHYPQLKDVQIDFVVDDVGIPLSSRPFWGTLFRSASNRTYKVIIDTNMEGRRAVLLLKNQPFNAQTGILGHELAHTVYYLDRSFFRIVADALCQLSQCRIDFERDTDKRLIEYGLGWQRYDHASFVRGNINIAVDSVSSTGNAYMAPSELLEIMKTNPAYNATWPEP